MSRISRIIAVALCLGAVVYFATQKRPPTAYELDLRQLNARIDELQKAAAKPAEDKDTLIAKLTIERASLTGDYEDYANGMVLLDGVIKAPRTERAFTSALMLRAYLNFKIHRFEAAHADLDQLRGAELAPEAQDTVAVLETDLAFHEGKFPAALKGYLANANSEPNWYNLSRLANYYNETGDAQKADALYAQAADKISFDELRDFAWVELQRGIILEDRANFSEALKHFEFANKAYSGYWLVEQHLASTKAKMGRLDEAAGLYRNLIARMKNPEDMVALANIMTKQNDPQATLWMEAAKAGFNQRLVLLPEATMANMVDMLLQSGMSEQDLLRMARTNLKLRSGAPAAKLTLAKVYEKFSEHEAAKKLVCEIQRTSWRSPKLDDFVGAAKFGRCL